MFKVVGGNMKISMWVLNDFFERKYEDLGALFVSLLYDRVFFSFLLPHSPDLVAQSCRMHFHR
jgi:hypothetical protein